MKKTSEKTTNIKTKKEIECQKQHPNHTELLPNINRIAGQIEGIKKMIENNRYCPDIIIQLRAIRSAVGSVETRMLEKHLDTCIKNYFDTKNKEDIGSKIEELKKLYKQFN